MFCKLWHKGGMAVCPPILLAHRGSPASRRNRDFKMNIAVKMNEEKGGEIFYLKPSKRPLSPALPDETDAPSPFIQADISTLCVSKDPPKRRAIVPARIVAEAVRLILDAELPPPREPGRDGSNDMEFGNLPAGWRVAGQDPLANPDLPGFRFGFNAKTARDIRSPFNRDLEYRSRAALRADCRRDPSAFSDSIPHDISDRVMIPNAFEEAHAVLQAVADKRPARTWLHADPDEQVTLIDYAPPQPRLRSRSIPGVVVSRDDDGAIKLTLRDRDLDSPSMRSAVANRREAKPVQKPEANVINLAVHRAYRRDWKQRFELAQRAA
jgi:hypothetical protein